MHIAICDDNYGDRHQMERLLRRESDKETDSSMMYIVHSYGSPEVMLSHPKSYDLFFIDMCNTEGADALDIVKSLTAAEVNAPIVMCVSGIDYRQMDFPENTLFLDKPVKIADLREILEGAKAKLGSAPDRIELRKVTETIYVDVSDVIYANEKRDDTMVHLTDGEVLMSIGKLWLFRRSLGKKHPEFIYANSHNLINCTHIKSVNKFRILTLSNGKHLLLSKSANENVKRYLEENPPKADRSSEEEEKNDPVND